MNVTELAVAGQAGRLVEQLDAMNEAELAATFGKAGRVGTLAWLVQSAAVGIAQRRARRGDRAIDGLAKLFGIHRSRTFRLAKIANEIIFPRLEADPDARFIAVNRSFCEAAVDASARLGRPALELLELAERRRMETPRYSVRCFKRELLGETPRDADAILRRAIRALAGLDVAELGEPPAEDLDAARRVLDEIASRRATAAVAA